MKEIRCHMIVRGRVQGVGFRYRAEHAAQTLCLTGWVRNEYDGSVTLEAQGSPDAVLQLLPMIAQGRYVEITGVTRKIIPPDPEERGFSVLD